MSDEKEAERNSQAVMGDIGRKIKSPNGLVDGSVAPETNASSTSGSYYGIGHALPHTNYG